VLPAPLPACTCWRRETARRRGTLAGRQNGTAWRWRAAATAPAWFTLPATHAPRTGATVLLRITHRAHLATPAVPRSLRSGGFAAGGALRYPQVLLPSLLRSVRDARTGHGSCIPLPPIVPLLYLALPAQLHAAGCLPPTCLAPARYPTSLISLLLLPADLPWFSWRYGRHLGDLQTLGRSRCVRWACGIA